MRQYVPKEICKKCVNCVNNNRARTAKYELINSFDLNGHSSWFLFFFFGRVLTRPKQRAAALSTRQSISNENSAKSLLSVYKSSLFFNPWWLCIGICLLFSLSYHFKCLSPKKELFNYGKHSSKYLELTISTLKYDKYTTYWYWTLFVQTGLAEAALQFQY